MSNSETESSTIAGCTVLLVTNIPTPYRIPLFNALAETFGRSGFNLKVAFGASGYSRRNWAIDMDECRFDYEILPSTPFHIGKSESASFTYGGLWSVIRREKPAVTIITGYSLGTVKLWLRSILFGEPYVIWSGAIADAAMPTPRLRMMQRRMLVRAAVAFIAYGSRAKHYLETLGAPPARISIGINTVDTQFYRQRALADGAERRRKKDFDLICLGDLSSRKRVGLALQAVALVSDVRRDFRLRLVGDGPERVALEKMANDLGISDIVCFEGYKQKDEVAEILAAAHCLLFPSRFDVWGLVLVEAMAAGIPCIASFRAGATEDLIQDEVTGFAVDFEDPRKVANRIEWMLDNRDAALAMGEAAADFIESDVTLERSAEGFLEAVKRAVSGR